MRYHDNRGRAFELGRKVGAGGEGSVFELANAPEFVAKLYNLRPSFEKAAKLSLMASIASERVSKYAAWPLGTLHESIGGAAIGFVMRRVPTSVKEIHELYSPVDRKTVFPDADWRFLVRTATNCAIAMAALHEHGVVIGDVNQKNFLVGNDALVHLIDCDSFQVPNGTNAYFCDVAVPEYLPPELHGAQLAHTMRTPNHDAFGLAVLIFHLLFMGRHPFLGYRGSEDMPIPRAIREFRFAYGSSASSLQMSPPPFSLPLACVTPELALCFERAFSHGSQMANVRPAPKEWVARLEALESQLRKCPRDPGHLFRSNSAECPWCVVVRDGGPNFFISVSIKVLQSGAGQTFDLQAVWVQITAVQAPAAKFLPVSRVDPSRVVAEPVPDVEDSSKTLRSGTGIVAIISGVLTVFALYDLRIAFFAVPMLIAFGIWWGVLEYDNPRRRIRSERRRALHQSEVAVRQVVNRGRSVAAAHAAKFDQCLQSLVRLRDQYQRVEFDHATELRLLQSSAHDRQRDEFLRSKRVSVHRKHIEGIGPGRLAALETYGIETAYDISVAAIGRVPGFGPKLTAALVGWRQDVLNRFRFDPSKGVPQADLQALELKFHQQRQQCASLLLMGPVELQRIAVLGVAEVEVLDRQIVIAENGVAQARANLSICT